MMAQINLLKLTFINTGGEPAILESQDHEHYRQIAKGRGEDFINSYDLG